MSTCLSDILQHSIETDGITRKQIAIAARVSESTAARWVTGETLPDYLALCQLIERLPQIAHAILLSMAGDRFRVLELPDREGDDLELGIDYLSETDVSQWIEASIMQRLNERASQ